MARRRTAEVPALEILRRACPGGSITGTPKVRAMETPTLKARGAAPTAARSAGSVQMARWILPSPSAPSSLMATPSLRGRLRPGRRPRRPPHRLISRGPLGDAWLNPPPVADGALPGTALALRPIANLDGKPLSAPITEAFVGFWDVLEM